MFKIERAMMRPTKDGLRAANSAAHAVTMSPRELKPPHEHLSDAESLDFELLYLLEREPNLSQRALADRLGISLGKVNYCLKGLLEKGALKLSNFRASNDKLRYIYVLAPEGLQHRLRLTQRFLDRKIAEYDRVKAQIDDLQREMSNKGGAA